MNYTRLNEKLITNHINFKVINSANKVQSKGRTIRKLMGGGGEGGRSTKKVFRKGKLNEKKFMHAS